MTEALMVSSFGLGMVASLIFSETIGLAAGGIILPGYLALIINDPLKTGFILIASFLVFLVVRPFSNFMFLYGRRRNVFLILIGFTIVFAMQKFFCLAGGEAPSFDPIGFFAPGLAANWMERQKVLPTLVTLVAAAVLVRMILLIFFEVK